MDEFVTDVVMEMPGIDCGADPSEGYSRPFMPDDNKDHDQIVNTIPTTIEELKDLCPPELKGLDRSAWISEQRQKFGI